MSTRQSLEAYLRQWAEGDPGRARVSITTVAIAETCGEIADLVARGSLAGDMAACVDGGVAGEAQKALDLRSNDMVIAGLRNTPVAYLASEEMADVVVLDKDGELAVAIDPLDGSSNIETNTSIGTIFGILPIPGGNAASADAVFYQPGSKLLAAGFAVYGPQTTLVLSVGQGTHVFTRDPSTGQFVLTGEAMQVPVTTREFAINASNRRHWNIGVCSYIDDCQKGKDGHRGENFNMRWLAALVAEAYRILVRGGIYLYPGDAREGYRMGRLRLVYEGNPIAFLMEQAGGAASDGRNRILELIPHDIHQRCPLIFGSRDEVERVERYVASAEPAGDNSPLFNPRGLLRRKGC